MAEHREELVFRAARRLGLVTQPAFGFVETGIVFVQGLQRLVAVAQRVFDLLAIGDLGFERARLLLQLGDAPQPRVRAGQARVALGRDDLRMLATDARQPRRVGVAFEAGDRIAAEQRKGHAAGELVPELLEAQRGVAVAGTPEQAHHLAERSDAAPPAVGCTRDDLTHGRVEALGMRPVVPHERVERPCGVEGDVAARPTRGDQVETMLDQPAIDRVAMRLGRDDEGGVSAAEAAAYEACHRLHQEGVVLVELDDVRRRRGRVVDRERRQRGDVREHGAFTMGQLATLGHGARLSEP